MDTPGNTQLRNDRSREDSAGDFVLVLSNILLGLSALSLTFSLLIALQAFADGRGTSWTLLVVAMCSAAVFAMSAAWSALWAKLKRMADDLHAIRQHVEKTGIQKGRTARGS